MLSVINWFWPGKDRQLFLIILANCGFKTCYTFKNSCAGTLVGIQIKIRKQILGNFFKKDYKMK